jgi:hypothetical protein
MRLHDVVLVTDVIPRRSWVDNIKMDWIDLARDRDQWRGSCEHGNESSGSIKCWEVFE